jgi:WD40 repeat protein
MRALLTAILLAGPAVAQPSLLLTLAVPEGGSSFVLAKNGKIAAAALPNKLILWSLPEGRMQRIIELGDRHIDVLAISADGASLAGGDHAGGYTVWSTATGSSVMHLKLPFYPMALAFSADAKRLAIAPANQPVQVYDPASGRKLFELQRPVGGTQAVVFSPDGSRIATADSDTVVRVYDSRNGELLSRNADFLMEPLAAAFSADGKQLLAGGGDKTIALLDAASGRAIRTSAKLADPVAYMEVSPDGALLAAVLMHADNMLMPGALLISEVSSGKNVVEWHPEKLPIGGAWTTDGHLLVATLGDKAIEIWKVR